MELPPEVRLKRYLHYGSEVNIYKPGSRYAEKNFSRECIKSVDELLLQNKAEYILDLLQTIYEDKTSCCPDALYYVLSEIARDEKLRKKALDVAEKICEKVESFIVFLKFSFEHTPKVGFGRSLRKFIQNWYLTKSYRQLAETVGEIGKYRGWRHADVIKLSHIKATDPAKAASLTYATRGVEAMKKEFQEKSNEETLVVIGYLETIENYRRNQNSVEVAAKIESYMLGIEHVNAKTLNDKQVWLALFRQMPVTQLLDNLQYISKRKMFRSSRTWDSIFVDTVVETMTKPYAKREGVTPNRVFIELMNYENKARIKLELAAKLQQSTKKPPLINPEITKALVELLETVLESCQKPTGKKFLILSEVGTELTKRRCQVSRYVSLADAAAFIIWNFSHTESSVKVFSFSTTGVKAFPVTKEESLKNTIENFHALNNSESMKVKNDEQIVKWLREYEKKEEADFDVCIILKSYGDNTPFMCVTSNNKSKKFIVCNFCGIQKNSKPPDTTNVLTVSGFDQHILRVISTYITDKF